MTQTAQKNALVGADADPKSAGKTAYMEALRLIERLHRRMLDVIKAELDKRGVSDINSVQALLLYNIGDNEMTAGELRSRGYYMGSNVSYNLKKLVEGGYIEHERSLHDRRSVRIRLSDKGQMICGLLDALYSAHVGEFAGEESGLKALREMNTALQALERFWSDKIRII
jgi:DNA-binding MarR family transcriptional regulator